MSNQYKHTEYIDMPDVTESYEMHLDFIQFFARIFMSELLYIHQTFTDCLSNQ